MDEPSFNMNITVFFWNGQFLKLRFLVKKTFRHLLWRLLHTTISVLLEVIYWWLIFFILQSFFLESGFWNIEISIKQILFLYRFTGCHYLTISTPKDDQDTFFFFLNKMFKFTEILPHSSVTSYPIRDTAGITGRHQQKKKTNPTQKTYVRFNDASNKHTLYPIRGINTYIIFLYFKIQQTPYLGTLIMFAIAPSKDIRNIPNRSHFSPCRTFVNINLDVDHCPSMVMYEMLFCSYDLIWSPTWWSWVWTTIKCWFPAHCYLTG